MSAEVPIVIGAKEDLKNLWYASAIMQFAVIAYDHKDGGIERRLAARERHVALGDKMKADGHYLMGVAILDEKGQMMGSIMILDYSSSNELNEWLEKEPYILEKVWDKIEIIPCKVGPTFLK